MKNDKSTKDKRSMKKNFVMTLYKDPHFFLKRIISKSHFIVIILIITHIFLFNEAYGYNVTINANNTTNGTWSSLTSGTYTFTATAANANVNIADIENHLFGAKNLPAGNVTITTGTTGNVTISTSIVCANTTSYLRTLTINAPGGSITVSSPIDLTAANYGEGYPATSIILNAGTDISITEPIKTIGGSAKSNGSGHDGGNGGNITIIANGNILIAALLDASGTQGYKNNNRGGNGGNISITGAGGINLTNDLTAIGGAGAGAGAAGTSGTITINDGATTITTNGTNNGQTSGIISAGDFIKQGSGAFYMSGANTYTGATSISEGTLSVSNLNNLGTATTAIILGGSTTKGTLNYTGTAAFTRGITINAGGGVISNTTGNTLTFSAAITNNGPLTLSNAGSGGMTMSGAISSSGSLTINNTSTGITTLSGTNTYTGATTISEGTLSVSNLNNLGTATTAIILGGSTTKGTLNYTGTAAFTRSFTVNAGGGVISNTTGNTLTFSAAITNNGPLTLSNAGSGGMTMSGAISSSGSLTINNTSTGITTLSGTNTYTGATTISAGTLKLNNAAALGTSTTTSVSSGATLDLNGITLSTPRPVTLNGGTLKNTTKASTFNGAITLGINSNIDASANLTLGGGITGTFKLTKLGTGILNTGTTLITISDLSISAGNLTIPAGGQVTVSGATEITLANGLTIESAPESENGTGSFITGSTSGPGTASVIRYMTPKRWHLVASPLSEQTIGAFLRANESIPTNSGTGAPTTAPYERGMRAYDVINNSWGDFLMENSTEKLTTGKGFSMRVRTSTTPTGTQRVTFTGQLQPGEHLVSVTPEKWNCVGNPYTSAIGIALGSGSTADFLTVNEDILDPSFGAIYVWNQPSGDDNNGEAWGSYKTISNATLSNSNFEVSTDTKVQQGQAFMVKIRPLVVDETTLNITFNKNMQLHQTDLALKSTDNIWPTIQLQATANDVNSATTIAFHEGMTNGLDVTYDAGLLKADSPIDLYTRLVDDYGIPFAIQALPSDQYDQLIIPVGVDYPAGGTVSFSAKTMYLPSSCRPILEDRLTGILTDLSDKTYTTDLSVNTAGTGRFYLHTSYVSTEAENYNNKHYFTAKFINHNQIKIQGKPITHTTITLTDDLGKLIFSRQMQERDGNILAIPNVMSGIYLLYIKSPERTQAIKLVNPY